MLTYTWVQGKARGYLSYDIGQNNYYFTSQHSPDQNTDSSLVMLWAISYHLWLTEATFIILLYKPVSMIFVRDYL